MNPASDPPPLSPTMQLLYYSATHIVFEYYGGFWCRGYKPSNPPPTPPPLLYPPPALTLSQFTLLQYNAESFRCYGGMWRWGYEPFNPPPHTPCSLPPPALTRPPVTLLRGDADGFQCHGGQWHGGDRGHHEPHLEGGRKVRKRRCLQRTGRQGGLPRHPLAVVWVRPFFCWFSLDLFTL